METLLGELATAVRRAVSAVDATATVEIDEGSEAVVTAHGEVMIRIERPNLGPAVYVVEVGEWEEERYRGLSLRDATRAAGVALATLLIDQALDALGDEQMGAALAELDAQERAARECGDFDLDESCPGCGHAPGDGLNPDCHHPEGCGFWREAEREETSVKAELEFDAKRERGRR